jgi:phenylalanyl-tRNA synthetase beta chain
VRAAAKAPWHPGRCAELLVGEAVVGHAGELHPKVCRAFGVPARTSVAELDLDALLDRAVSVPTAPTLSAYPVAKEDVALVVADDLPAEELAATLRKGAGPLCESVRLFDVYTGPQVGEGHRSLAFALRFRAPDRTLTEKDTATAREAAVALAAERHGAQQRV